MNIHLYPEVEVLLSICDSFLDTKNYLQQNFTVTNGEKVAALSKHFSITRLHLSNVS